jgi:folate-binding protein YgfZ
VTGAVPSPSEQFAAVTSGVALAALNGTALFRLSGADARETLERIVTQQVGTLAPGEGRLALLLAPKGQFRALMEVFGTPDGLLLLPPPGFGDELATALAKYLAFSRSRLEPVDLAGGAALVGPRWAEVARACGADADRLAGGGCHVVESGTDQVWWFGQTFLGVPGALVLGRSASSLGPVRGAVASNGGVDVSPAVLECARIEAHWPAWGRELTETVLPPEVGLEAAAISYTKGCYVGQETIARMQTYGHPTRRLARLSLIEGPLAAPRLPLPISLEGGSRRGELTSFAVHPSRGGIALGLVRREGAEEGTVWLAEGRRFMVANAPG